MKYAALFGRIIFASIFVMSAPVHFSKDTINFAAAAGVPLASIAVPISGILALIGGLSVALGYKAKWGAWLLVLFLVPVSFMMHNFWSVSDPMTKQMQMVMFFKNMSILGASVLVTYFGSGPLSLDEWVSEHSLLKKKNLQSLSKNTFIVNK